MIRKTFLLRLFLASASFGWGISVVAVFLPWETASAALQGLGAPQLQYHPMLDYWLRMAAGSFTFVGVLFAIAAISPHKYKSMITILGLLSIMEGSILLIYGIMLNLSAFPFCSDALFCLLTGTATILLNKPGNK